MTNSIETETILLPDMIAELAIQEVIEEDKRFTEVEGKQLEYIFTKYIPLLVAKAEHCYRYHKDFKRKVRTRNGKQNNRDYLLMFMAHWFKAIYGREDLINITKQLYENRN